VGLFDVEKKHPAALSSGDDRARGGGAALYRIFVGCFAGRQGYVRPFSSLAFLLCEIEHLNP
jgi:hypothetical protein